MDYCSEIATSSCQPNLNMYDREAVPLTLPNHSSASGAYSSPLHSPTSTTNGPPMAPHSIPPPLPPHHYHPPHNSLSSPAVAHGRPPPPQVPREHISPNSTSKQESPTEGDGLLDSADDNSLSQGGDAGGQVDSSNPKQVFVPCKVCGDKASGYHYGVTSCEGCKGFFRRSIQKQIDYRCLRDGKCLVIRLNRNRCQYCRFRKCLAVGMSRDSVRYGRVPKRSKSLEQSGQQPQQQPNSTTPDTEPVEPAMTAAAAAAVAAVAEDKQRHNVAVYDMVLTIAQSHHCHCLTTDDKANSLTKRNVSLSPIKEERGTNGSVSTIEMLETNRSLMFNRLTELITPTIQNVVEFAKRIPGFSDIGQDDQLMLIKAGFFEAWLTHLAKFVDMENASMMFSDGSIVSRNQLEFVLNPDIVSGMFTFCQSFRTLGLNDTEIGLFTAVLLTTADRVSIVDRASVERVQSRLMEALKLQLTRRGRSQGAMDGGPGPGAGAGASLFPTLLLKLPELRSLSTQLATLLDWFRQRWHTLTLPPLFAEIFDIPKCEDDL